MALLNVSGISKQQGNVWVLKDISFQQHAFHKTAIAGETGSGKSSLLKVIAGLEQPASGTVLFESKKVAGPDETLVPGHPSIAYLSQYYELCNNYRMEELLEYANKLSVADAENLFSLCRIGHLLKRKNDQLSGGEKQRIALARLLVGAPRLLLLDEPFSNLDPIHKNILKSVLNEIGERLQITCILTSHDPLDTLSWADEILVMKEGQIIQHGKPEDIYHRPLTEYTAGLFGTYNLLGAEQAALFGCHQVIPAGKRLLIRPEQFNISGEGHGVQAIIEKVNFRGNYYELETIIQGQPVRVLAITSGFAKGDTVFISAGPVSNWSI